jgi:hypothetical protein
LKLIGLVDGMGSGGAKGAGDEWSLVFNLTAWREPPAQPVVAKRRCELPIPKAELDGLMDRIAAYALIEAEVERVTDGATILRRIVRSDAKDARLERISAELRTRRALDRPPFPLLTWTQYETWEGSAVLPAWRGFQSRKGPYAARDAQSPSDGVVQLTLGGESGPTEYQSRAFRFQLEHGPQVVSAVLEALLPYYRQLRADWSDALADDEELARAMPEVSDDHDFRSLIGLAVVHVHPYCKGDLGYVGLEFGCTWDEEHGLGVMLHGARVVSIGAAAVSFAWKPDEAD